jgi:hypothetical protein
MDLLLPIPADAIFVGLEMLARGAKGMHVAWSLKKYMKVMQKRGRLQVMTSQSPQGDVTLEYLSGQEILSRLKSMGRTSRKQPLVVVKSKCGSKEALIP